MEVWVGEAGNREMVVPPGVHLLGCIHSKSSLTGCSLFRDWFGSTLGSVLLMEVLGATVAK